MKASDLLEKESAIIYIFLELNSTVESKSNPKEPRKWKVFSSLKVFNYFMTEVPII